MSVANRPRDEFIDLNGLRLHYQEWGDERARHAVILLHGYGETAAAWDEVAVDLGRDFRVIALDLRGHGQSGRATDRDYTRASQVEDIGALVEALNLRTVTMVGHAMGGADAIAYAAEHPEIVTALVAIETAPEVLRSGIEKMRRLLGAADTFPTLDSAAAIFHEFYPTSTTEQIERRLHACLTPTEDGAFRWAFDPVFLDPTARPPDADPGQRRMANLWDSVERIQCPTLIVRGTDTDMVTPEAIQRLHRRMPGSRVSLIEESGHSVPTDQPAALAQHIREFLQSLSASPI